MSVDRRAFLRGLLALAVAANLPVLEYAEKEKIKLSSSDLTTLDELVTEALRRQMPNIVKNLQQQNQFLTILNARPDVDRE